MKTQKYFRSSLLIFALLLFVACQKDVLAKPANTTAPAVVKNLKKPIKSQIIKHKLSPEKPELNVTPAPKLPRNAANAFLSFKDLKVHVGKPDKGMGQYVLGNLKDGQFLPQDQVYGIAPPKPKGARAPGWLELADGSFHMAATGRPPFKPFVSGILYTESGFVSGDKTISR